MITHVVTFKMRDPSPEHLTDCKARLDEEVATFLCGGADAIAAVDFER